MPLPACESAHPITSKVVWDNMLPYFQVFMVVKARIWVFVQVVGLLYFIKPLDVCAEGLCAC